MNFMVPFIVLIVAGSAMGYTAVTFKGISNYIPYMGITMIATLGFVYANSKLDSVTYVVGTNSIIGIVALIVICIKTHNYPNPYSVVGMILMIVGTYLTTK